MPSEITGVNSYYSTNSIASKTGANNLSSDLDMDDFITLLVAEMQNQDVLNPTSNTEFISQMATFSSLSAIKSLQQSLTSMMSFSMIGKEVTGTTYVEATKEVDGQTYKYMEKVEVNGVVDSVTFANGEPFLVVDGVPISLSDIKEVK